MRKYIQCKVNGCSSMGNVINGVEYFTKGYCKKHYLRLFRYGDISINKAPKGENRKDNPLYVRYLQMISRCYKKNDHRYHNYGGRGIRVCERWLEPNGQGFRNFCSDLLTSYLPTLELDRIDVDGDYEPMNVKWSTRSQQMRNMQNTRYITLGGITKCVADWSDDLGVSQKRIWGRLLRGWGDEESLKPIGHRRNLQKS